MPINAPAGMAAGELVVSGAIDEVIEETDELASLALLSVDELPPEHADSPSAAAAAKPAMAIRFGVRVMWLNFLVWRAGRCRARFAVQESFGATGHPDGSGSESGAQ